MKLNPNRVATWLTAASGLSAAIAVPVANLDPTDILPGLGAIAVAFVTWMQGWQKHEARQAATAAPAAAAAPVYVDEDNSVLEATDGDALAPTGPVLDGHE